MNKNSIIHILTIIILLGSCYFILPNLFVNVENLQQEKKILRSTYFEVKENRSRRTKMFIPEYTTLVLVMTDGTYLEIGDQYEDFWNGLLDKKWIGKEIRYYPSINHRPDRNPLQLEIEDRIIWSTKDGLGGMYLFLVVTLLFTVYSGWKLIQYLIQKKNLNI